MKKNARTSRRKVLLPAAAALLLAWTAAAAGQGRTETAYRRFIEVENFRIEGKGHQVRAHENSSGGATMDSVFPDTGRLEAGGRLLFTLETPRPAGRYLVWLNTLPLGVSRTAAGPIRIEAGLGRTARMIEIHRNARYNWGYAFIEARESFQEISLKVRSLEDRLWLDCLYLSNQPADLKANGRDGRPEINLKAIRGAAAGRSGSAAGEKTANRLANGGFEAGLGSYYWSTLYQQSYALKPEFWDRKEAYEGSASLRLTLFPEAGRRLGDDPGLPTAFRLMHRSLELEPDRTYHFRAMVKADTPLLVRFSASPAQPPETGRIRPAGQAILQADGQWRPLEAELKTLGAGQDYLLRLEAEATGPARLWLDALTLTDTRLEAFRPAAPVEAGVHWSAPGKVFHLEEPVSFTLLARNYADGAATVNLRYRVIDYFDRLLLEERTGNWPVAAGRTGERTVDLNRGRTGAFRLLVDGEAVTPAGRVQLPLQEYAFSVLRRPPERMAGSFGAYITIAPEPIEIMGRAGIRRTVTLSSSNNLLQSWREIEPEPGKFVWVDRRVAHALANGVAITANLHIGSGGDEVPKWARDPVDPADVLSCTGSRMAQDKKFTFSKQAWERFIEAVVGHYKESIQEWLIMDEPYYVFKAEEYAELLKSAYRAAKRANPNCRVLAHGGYYAPWLPALEKAGAVPFFDAISDYARDLEQGQRLRDFARKHGKTVFNVEYGGHSSGYRSIETPEDTNDRRIPVYQVNAQSVLTGALRAMGWSAAEGFRRYDARFPGGDFTQLDRYMSFFEYDGGLKPAAVAYATAGRLLDGFRGAGALELHNRLEAFLFEKEGRFLLAFWARENDLFQTQFLLPPEVSGFDLMGNPLEAGRPLAVSGSPNYLAGPDSRREETLNLLRNLLVRELVSLEAETRLDEASGGYRLRVTIANLDPGRPIQNGVLTISGSGTAYGSATLLRESWDRVRLLPEVKPGGRMTIELDLNAYRDEIRTARPATLELFLNGASRAWKFPDIFKAGTPAAAP